LHIWQLKLEQRAAIDKTIERLEYKISRYEKAMETGVLSWDNDDV
jgi:hypothetical protein